MSDEPRPEGAEDLEEELAREATGEVQAPDQASAFEGSVQSAEGYMIDPSLFKWKVFLAGPSGSGKTTAACMTLPGKKLLVDMDNRAEAVVGVPDLDIYNCHEPEPKSPAAWNKVERLRSVMLSEIRK